MLAADTSPAIFDQNYFFKFGALLGYSFVAGIQDLHRENVIFSQHGPLVVDTEVVLSQLKLPDQTQLLRRRSTQFDFTTAISKMSEDSNELEEKYFWALTDGFIQSLVGLAQEAQSVAATIQKSISSRGSKPKVRVLFKATSTYRKYLSGEETREIFSSSELIQLQRNDVPYFFKFIDSPDVYFMKSETESANADPDPSQKALADIVGLSPQEIFNSERILRSLLPQGIFYLLKHHLNANWSGNWKNRFVDVEVDRQMRLQYKDASYSASRE